MQLFPKSEMSLMIPTFIVTNIPLNLLFPPLYLLMMCVLGAVITNIIVNPWTGANTPQSKLPKSSPQSQTPRQPPPPNPKNTNKNTNPRNTPASQTSPASTNRCGSRCVHCSSKIGSFPVRPTACVTRGASSRISTCRRPVLSRRRSCSARRRRTTSWSSCGSRGRRTPTGSAGIFKADSMNCTENSKRGTTTFANSVKRTHTWNRKRES